MAGLVFFGLLLPATMASKIRAFMKKPYALLIACAVFCALATTAQAEKADKDKPMNIEADSMRYDDLKQVNVFTGKVQMIKGTILSRGARVDIRKDPQGYQYGVVTAEPGKLAYFRQKREGVDEYIEGEADMPTSSPRPVPCSDAAPARGRWVLPPPMRPAAASTRHGRGLMRRRSPVLRDRP